MNPNLFEVTTHDFETQVLKSDLPVLIEFTSEWCPPCKMLAPIMNELARRYEGNMRVGMLDSDANPAIIRQYHVMGLPTLLLFIDGSPVERVVGFTAIERIESKILPHLRLEKA